MGRSSVDVSLQLNMDTTKISSNYKMLQAISEIFESISGSMKVTPNKPGQSNDPEVYDFKLNFRLPQNVEGSKESKGHHRRISSRGSKGSRTSRSGARKHLDSSLKRFKALEAECYNPSTRQEEASPVPSEYKMRPIEIPCPPTESETEPKEYRSSITKEEHPLHHKFRADREEHPQQSVSPFKIDDFSEREERIERHMKEFSDLEKQIKDENHQWVKEKRSNSSRKARQIERQLNMVEKLASFKERKARDQNGDVTVQHLLPQKKVKSKASTKASRQLSAGYGSQQDDTVWKVPGQAMPVREAVLVLPTEGSLQEEPRAILKPISQKKLVRSRQVASRSRSRGFSNPPITIQDEELGGQAQQQVPVKKMSGFQSHFKPKSIHSRKTSKSPSPAPLVPCGHVPTGKSLSRSSRRSISRERPVLLHSKSAIAQSRQKSPYTQVRRKSPKPVDPEAVAEKRGVRRSDYLTARPKLGSGSSKPRKQPAPSAKKYEADEESDWKSRNFGGGRKQILRERSMSTEEVNTFESINPAPATHRPILSHFKERPLYEQEQRQTFFDPHQGWSSNLNYHGPLEEEEEETDYCAATERQLQESPYFRQRQLLTSAASQPTLRKSEVRFQHLDAAKHFERQVPQSRYYTQMEHQVREEARPKRRTSRKRSSNGFRAKSRSGRNIMGELNKDIAMEDETEEDLLMKTSTLDKQLEASVLGMLIDKNEQFCSERDQAVHTNYLLGKRNSYYY